MSPAPAPDPTAKSATRILLLTIMLASLATLGACISFEPQVDPSRFFLLDIPSSASAPQVATIMQATAYNADSSATATGEEQPQAQPPAEEQDQAQNQGLRLGIGRVELPPYLTQNRIAIRESEYEIRYSNIHQWAEPLEDGLQGLIHRRILSRPEVASAMISPPTFSGQFDYFVTIHINRFEAESSGAAVVDADYTIRDARSLKEPDTFGQNHSRQYQFTSSLEGWDGNDYGAMTAMLSQLAIQLSDDIGRSMLRLGN